MPESLRRLHFFRRKGNTSQLGQGSVSLPPLPHLSSNSKIAASTVFVWWECVRVCLHRRMMEKPGCDEKGWQRTLTECSHQHQHLSNPTCLIPDQVASVLSFLQSLDVESGCSHLNLSSAARSAPSRHFLQWRSSVKLFMNWSSCQRSSPVAFSCFCFYVL